MTATANARAFDRLTVRKQRSVEAPHLGGRPHPKGRSYFGGRSSPLKPIEINIKVDTEEKHDPQAETKFGYESGSGPVAASEMIQRDAGDSKLNLHDPEQGSCSDFGDRDPHHDDGEGENSEFADDSGSEDNLVSEGREQ